MPEGHVLHRLARELGADLDGRQVRAASPQGKFADGSGAVDGARVRGVDAFGKHLLVHVGDGPRAEVDHTVHVHLGMRGKFFRTEDPGRPPLPQVRLRLATDGAAWDLVAPSRCELLDEVELRRLVEGLGPDPLRDDADPAVALANLARSRAAIGAALLNQSLLSGVGNVFRSEALHAIGVAPGRQSGALDVEQLGRLWAVLEAMMRQAVEDGRIVTVTGPDRLAIPESEARKVYKQERCRDCRAEVVWSTVGGRTAYHCPVEQPH